MAGPKAAPPPPPPAPVPKYSDAQTSADQLTQDILKRRNSLNNTFLAGGGAVQAGNNAMAGRPFLG